MQNQTCVLCFIHRALTIRSSCFDIFQFQALYEDSRNTPPNRDENSDQGYPKLKASSIKPQIIVIVGVLTVLLFTISLLLLYVKHCKADGSMPISTPQVDRNNSGIERLVVESLPLFRFRSLRGQKEGLECAVCLNRFEPIEILRLLPECKHAFHVECLDTWLHAHSTCPLCRYKVDTKDIPLIEDDMPLPLPLPLPVQEDVVLNIDPDRVVTGRNSSVGEGELRNKKWRTLSLDESGKKRWLSSSLSSSSSSSSSRRRVEHRIVVSECDGQRKECDLVLVPQDMLLTTHDSLVNKEVSRIRQGDKRSVSAFTSLSRFPTIRVEAGASTNSS